jgi:hypothetical protein
MSGLFDIDGPRLKPSLRHLMDILLPEPLAFSSALATPTSIGLSEGVKGVPPIFAEDETRVGLEMTIGPPPRLVGLRWSGTLTEGVR